MLVVPAGQPTLVASTLPEPSFASTRTCAAAAEVQLLTSLPFTLKRVATPVPVALTLTSWMAKSVAAHAAWAAMGATISAVAASSIFIGLSSPAGGATRKRLGWGIGRRSGQL